MYYSYSIRLLRLIISTGFQGSFVRHGLSQQECEVEALFMFVAGSDTTAAAIRVTLLYILSSPLVYHRLKHEIAEALREERVSSPIKQSEAKSLPYLQVSLGLGLFTMKHVLANILMSKT